MHTLPDLLPLASSSAVFFFFFGMLIGSIRISDAPWVKADL